MIIKATHPLISCLCITNNRPELLYRSIASYYAQGYPNKELVVSYPKSDQVSKKVIDDILLKNSSLRIIQLERPDGYTVGAAKNHAITKCTGNYICTWDDDDWYYTNRLSHQFNNLKGNGKFYEASYLTRIFLYDSTTQKTYYSFPYFWNGSLLCNKELILQYPFLDSNQAEDSQLLQFLEFNNLIYQIADSHYLYTYVYHGQNITDYYNFQYLLKKSLQLNNEDSDSLVQQLGKEYII